MSAVDEDYYVLPLRVIRFKLTDATYECLITNLDRDEFPFEVMKELYHLRWNVMTCSALRSKCRVLINAENILNLLI